MDEKRKRIGEKTMERLKSDFGIEGVLHRVEYMDFYYVHVGVEPGTISSCHDKMDSRIITFHLDDVEVVEAHVVLEAHLDLVPAKLGDWVLIYSTYHDEDEWHVGLVTSVRKQGDEKAYGVRHFYPSSWLDRPTGDDDLLAVSEETYGGLPTGFAKVLTEEEALDRIEAQVKREAEDRIEKIKKAIPDVRKTARREASYYKNKVTIERIQQDRLRPKNPFSS